MAVCSHPQTNWTPEFLTSDKCFFSLHIILFSTIYSAGNSVQQEPRLRYTPHLLKVFAHHGLWLGEGEEGRRIL